MEGRFPPRLTGPWPTELKDVGGIAGHKRSYQAGSVTPDLPRPGEDVEESVFLDRKLKL